MSRCGRTCWVVGSVVFAYFVVYPSDLVVLVQPFGVLAGAIGDILQPVLELSNGISPWFYGTVIAGIACWSATRIWGQPPKSPAKKASRAKAG